MSNWYYLKNSERYGPVTGDTMATLLQAGKVAENTMVWTGGMDSWRPLRETTGIDKKKSTREMTIKCSVCGKSGPAQLFSPTFSGHICGNCTPSDTFPTSEASVRYAGFWIRAVATVVDSLILAIPAYLISLLQTAFLGRAGPDVMMLLFGALYSLSANLAVAMAYEVYFLGTYSATPGKMLLNLKIRTSSGQGISYVRALARFLAQILSAIPFGVGYLMAGIDREKRALHDHICHTRVVHAATPYQMSKTKD